MNDFRTLRNWILASDLGWLVASMILACLLRYGSASTGLPRSVLLAFSVTLLASALVWMILWYLLRLDGFRGGWRFPAVVCQLLLGVAIVMGIVLASGYLMRIYVSRLVAGYFGVLILLGFIAIRLLARLVLSIRYRSGEVRRVVIVGSGPVAREAAEKIQRHPEALCRVVGFLAGGNSALEVLTGPGANNVVNVRTCGIMELLTQQKVDELIFVASRNSSPEVGELITQSLKCGLGVSVIPQPYELYLSTPELMDLDGLPILRLHHLRGTSAEPFWKRVLDLSFAAFLLLAFVPVVVIAACILRVKKGKAFCREERCGRGGKPFRMYRLNSPRREVGLPFYERIMQHLSVTELPQLLNVLSGDMSLVGPRPEVMESVRHYTEWHLRRLSVKPGITGLAQVHGLRDQNTLEDKTRYDLQYILHRSLFQDISLLLQTLWTLIRRLSHIPNLRKPSAVPPGRSTSTIPA
ncbi:MAG TPA: sugar transferase [Terriglobales bacterium]|nr:sugar transferase [Terriglobales bacterium]HXY48992.1 sugar transferase [Terriglobales bacterium]